MTDPNGSGGGKQTLLLAAAALIVACAALALALDSRRASGPVADKAATQALVRDYLLDNPEIIPEAIRVLQRREEMAATERMERAVAGHWGAISTDAFSPVIGDTDAPVTVVEYYDYQCSFCRRAYPDVARLLDEHGARIRYVFKQFPVLDSPGDRDGLSHLAARAALAAERQGRFFEFHDRMMRRDGRLSEARIFEIAESTGLDVERLRQDMADPAFDDYFDETVALARSVGISGTPTYVIDRRVLEGALGYEAMLALVEQAASDGGAAIGGE